MARSLKSSPSPIPGYAESGAMRLPNFHPLILALIDKLELRELASVKAASPATATTN